MNKMMGYILIIVGMSITIFGIVLTRRTSDISGLDKVNESEQAESEKASETIKVQSDDIDENKVKGDAFEKYVVKNFNKKYFTLKEWRSDKIVDSTYAVSNLYPDLEIEFNLPVKDGVKTFAVECKWRKDYYKNAIEWAKDYQLKNYKKYEKDSNVPVFIVIGVGGQPEAPQDLFIIPLRETHNGIISINELTRYKRSATGEAFFWDAEKVELR